MSSKRSSVFDQGKPERPYEERDTGPVDVPRRATAAQMASRKIKTLRTPRRGLLTVGELESLYCDWTPVFVPITRSPENHSSSSSSFTGVNNSFPPAQASDPGNSFSNSSFPAFNPQPPAADFNFSNNANSNPFAQSTPAPTMNESGGTSGFSGNIFNLGGAQSQVQPAGKPGSLFGSSQPSNNPFGNFGSTGQGSNSIPAASSTPSAGFAFGTPAQNEAANTTAPASNLFGVSATPTNNAFGGFGSTSQGSNPMPAASSTPSAGFAFGTPTQNKAANTTAPSSNLFGVSATPTNNAFGGFGSTSQGSNSIPTASSTPSAGFAFGTPAQNKAANTTAPASNLFGVSATPTNNTFGGFGFGQSNNASTAPETSNGPFGATTGMGSGLFGSSTGSSQSNTVKTTGAPSNSTFGGGTGVFGQSNNTFVSAAPETTANSFGTSTASNNIFGNSTFGMGNGHPMGTAPEPSKFSAAALPADASMDDSSQNNTSATPKAIPRAPIPPSTSSFAFLQASQSGTPTASTVSEWSGVFSSSTSPQTNIFGASPAVQNTPTINSVPPSTTNLFGGSTTPKGNPFSGISSFGSSAKNGSTPSTTQGNNLFNINSTSKGGLFGGLGNTPQTISKASDSATPTSGLFGSISSTLASKPSTSGISEPDGYRTSLFEKSHKPSTEAAKPLTSTLFAPKTSEPQVATITPLGNISKPNLQAEPSEPETVKKAPSFFSPQKNLAPVAPQSSGPKNTLTPALFLKPTEQSPQVQDTPVGPSNMPTLTGATPHSAEVGGTPQLLNIPKAHIPSDWNKPSTTDNSPIVDAGSLHIQLRELAAQLATLNQKFRDKLSKLSPMVDWTALSKWHAKESQALMKKIADAKKEQARLKGITGNESTLSTKRKSKEDDGPNDNSETPSKKQRGGSNPPQPNVFGQTLKPSEITKPSQPGKDASQTSHLFGSILSKPTSSTLSASTTKQPAVGQDDIGSANAKPFGGFVFKPVTEPKTNESSPIKATTANFFSQFSKSAKTVEELTEERKKADAADDFDSEDESYDEWSARWDAKEAKRKAAEAAKTQGASTPGFTLSVPTTPSDAAGAKSPFNIAKPATGPSTSLFGSRVGSPTPSASGLSVFDTTSAAPSPASNIFGHLSSGPSSNNRDDFSDGEQEEDDDEDRSKQVQESTDEDQSDRASSKRKFDDSESGGEELPEEQRSKKKTITGSDKANMKVNFWDPSRMTKGPSTNVDSENEDSSTSPKSSGALETPKRTFQFDFAGARALQEVQTAPKPSAADQTYKIGSPIRFGSQTEAKQSAGTSLFNIQPSTPTPTESGVKPSLFAPGIGSSSSIKPSFLNPSASSSLPSSALTSRAPTPLSDVGTDQGSPTDNELRETPSPRRTSLGGLTIDEKDEYDVLFSQDDVIVKHQVRTGDKKEWAIFARGRLWILKNKETGKALVRMRLPSGNTPLNYNILPRLATSIHGKSQNMISATRQEGSRLEPLFFTIKQTENVEESRAAEFSRVYNENLPAS